jgi:hypothetical protein
MLVGVWGLVFWEVFMPTYFVRKVYEFCPGTDENGFTEDVPDDLLDESGSLFVLALWPKDRPLEVEAADEDDAIQVAIVREQKDGTCHLHPKLSEARFDELCKRQRPGGGPNDRSVTHDWQALEKKPQMTDEAQMAKLVGEALTDAGFLKGDVSENDLEPALKRRLSPLFDTRARWTMTFVINGTMCPVTIRVSEENAQLLKWQADIPNPWTGADIHTHFLSRR